MVVLPEPCPPAKPIIKGLFFLAFLEIQKQVGIRKDHNRSNFCYKDRVMNSFEELLKNIQA